MKTNELQIKETNKCNREELGMYVGSPESWGEF